jgi:hypothetical protein
MVPNSREEKKIPKKTVDRRDYDGRFKSFFAETLSRFRSPQSTYSAICAAIIALNLVLLF